jgi:hypothetical protein
MQGRITTVCAGVQQGFGPAPSTNSESDSHSRSRRLSAKICTPAQSVAYPTRGPLGGFVARAVYRTQPAILGARRKSQAGGDHGWPRLRRRVDIGSTTWRTAVLAIEDLASRLVDYHRHLLYAFNEAARNPVLHSFTSTVILAEAVSTSAKWGGALERIGRYTFCSHTGCMAGTFSTPSKDMAADFVADLRRVQPQGPYHLAGHCNGD